MLRDNNDHWLYIVHIILNVGVLWRFLLIQGIYTVHPCMMVTWKLVDGWTWQLTIWLSTVIVYHDVVTDWSSALAGFLVSMLFGVSLGQSYSNFSHANVECQEQYKSSRWEDMQDWKLFYCCYVELLCWIRESVYFKWQPCFVIVEVPYGR